MNLLAATHFALTLLLVALVATAWWRWRGLAAALPDTSHRDLLLPGLALAAALLVRFVLSHPTVIHSNFHGMRYLETALATAVTDPAELPARTKYGLGNYTFYAFLWHFLPRSTDMYFAVNTVLSSLLVPLVYFFVRLLEGGRMWAFFSALTLAFLPAHIKLSATENDVLLCSFFALVSLVNWAAWLRMGRCATSPGVGTGTWGLRQSTPLLLGSAAALVLAVHTRVLSAAFPLALLLLLPFFGRESWRHLIHPAALAIMGFAGLLMGPHYFHVWNLLHASHSAAARSLDLVVLPLRLLSPAHNLLLDPMVTMPLLPLLVVAGFGGLAALHRVRGLALTALVLFFGALYLYFSEHLLDSLRYQFFLWPWYAVAAAAPLEWLRLKWGSSPRRQMAVSAVAAAVVCALFLPYLPWLTTPHVITQEFDFIRTGLAQLSAGTKVTTTGGGFDVAMGRIPSFELPPFLLEEYGLTSPDGSSTNSPEVLYMGLQDYVFTISEDPAPFSPRYLRHRSLSADMGTRLVPVVTRTLRPGGDSPGPGLYFPADEVTIGFYASVPAAPSR